MVVRLDDPPPLSYCCFLTINTTTRGPCNRGPAYVFQICQSDRSKLYVLKAKDCHQQGNCLCFNSLDDSRLSK